jgi:hypothetical protein
LGATLVIGMAALPASAKLNYRWEQWKPLSRVYDVVSTGGHKGLLAATPDGLFSLDVGGNIGPVAQGPSGFKLGNDSESYIEFTDGLHVTNAGCDFGLGDAFVLALGKPLGLTRIDSSGRASQFATITGPDSLNGIAFDNTGKFDHRLLVTGPKSGKTEVLAVDCKGTVATITTNAPVFEGGIAVAPDGFGAFGGNLIAPDENSDQIWAVAPDGSSHLVTTTGIAKGQDIGVESLGFVPAGFMATGGSAYVADRGTPGNPHPGTDTILRYPSTEMVVAHISDGDLMVASEGGGLTVRVSCRPNCTADLIGRAADAAHIEGHIAFAWSGKGSSSPPSAPRSESPFGLPAESAPGTWLLLLAVALALVAALAGIALLVRRVLHRRGT